MTWKDSGPHGKEGQPDLRDFVALNKDNRADQAVPNSPPSPIPARFVIRPPLVIPSAVEGSALRLSGSTKLSMSSCIGQAWGRIGQLRWLACRCLQGTGGGLGCGSLRVSDTGAHGELCGARKAQSRSLDCARDDKRGGPDDKRGFVTSADSCGDKRSGIRFCHFSERET